MLTSTELRERLERNPHNLSGKDHMCNLDLWAARFEAEGRRAYLKSLGGNPYNAGTMAHDRWAKGFMDARGEQHVS